VLAGSAGQEIPQILVAALSLAAVLLLIAALSWLLRRAPALLPATVPPGAGLQLRATLRLDPRRRLHLVEAGGHQALVLTGGTSEVIVPLPPPAA
jgi:flagellar biogenesis protein FliO